MNRLARQSGAVTIPDLIKARFRSESVGMIATLLVLFFMFFYLLAQFKAGSKIMTTLLQDVAIYQSAVNAVGGAIDGLPWIGSAEPDYVLCLLVFAFSVIVYTAFGGFRAVVWTDVMQGIVMGVGVIILLFLTLGQVGGLTKATEQLKEMTPPETGIGIVTLGQAHTETTTLPKGGWLRLSDGGIARLAEQASLAKGETRTEAKLLKITTPAEVDRIEPTDFGFTCYRHIHGGRDQGLRQRTQGRLRQCAGAASGEGRRLPQRVDWRSASFSSGHSAPQVSRATWFA